MLDNYGLTKLAGKKDGSSYIKEYMEILENGSTLGKDDTIGNIILEEADTFFEGGRSARDTAKIIQNRVQLYLDEK